MALFAKANKTIEKIGRSIPTPFSETTVSPDDFSNWYTNNPSKKKFMIILSRPNINWDFLFLNKKMEITDKDIIEYRKNTKHAKKVEEVDKGIQQDGGEDQQTY